MSNASKARVRLDRRPGPSSAADGAAGATCPDAEKERPSATRVAIARQKARAAAAAAARKRARIIVNLLAAVRAGRLNALGQLGAWGDALVAARLIAESADGLTLTPAGRGMLTEIMQKHTASPRAPVPVALPARRAVRRRPQRGGDKATTTMASS